MEWIVVMLFVLVIAAAGFVQYVFLLAISAHDSLRADPHWYRREHRRLYRSAAWNYWAAAAGAGTFLACGGRADDLPFLVAAAVLWTSAFVLRRLTRWSVPRPPRLALVPKPEPEERAPYWFSEEDGASRREER